MRLVPLTLADREAEATFQRKLAPLGADTGPEGRSDVSDLVLWVGMLGVGLAIGLVGIQLLVAVGVLLFKEFRSRGTTNRRPRRGRVLSRPSEPRSSPEDPGIVFEAIGTEPPSQTTTPRSSSVSSTPGAPRHIAPASNEALPDPSEFLPDLPHEASLSASSDADSDSDDGNDELLLSGYRRSEYHKYGATDEDIDFWGLDQPGAPAPEERRWAVWDQAEQMDRDARGVINDLSDDPFDLFG